MPSQYNQSKQRHKYNSNCKKTKKVVKVHLHKLQPFTINLQQNICDSIDITATSSSGILIKELPQFSLNTATIQPYTNCFFHNNMHNFPQQSDNSTHQHDSNTTSLKNVHSISNRKSYFNKRRHSINTVSSMINTSTHTNKSRFSDTA
mgnify:CR=1 FL=1